MMSDYEDSYEYMVDELAWDNRKLSAEVKRLRPFVTDIAALDLTTLSPIDALSKLYELQRQARAVVKGGE
jgi:hypothetical protein